MAVPTFSRLSVPRNVLRVGILLLKACLFLPLPLLCQNRAVSTVSIPFAFSTGNHTMPAGEYVVTRVTESTYALRSTAGTATQYVSVYHDFAMKVPEESQLVFRKYDGQCFLANLWFGGSRDGLKIRAGKAERELLAASQRQSRPGVLMAVAVGAAPRP